MVVHHDDLTLHGLLSGLLHEAVFVLRAALLAETVLARTRHERPQAVVLGHVGQFRPIARAAERRETQDLSKPQVRLRIRKPSFGFRERQTKETDVVGPPLEQRNLDGNAERVPQRGGLGYKCEKI